MSSKLTGRKRFEGFQIWRGGAFCPRRLCVTQRGSDDLRFLCVGDTPAKEFVPEELVKKGFGRE